MPSQKILPSATLILLRQTQQGIETVLMQRHSAMAFGSAWVFPGGKIDPQDIEKAKQESFSQRKSFKQLSFEEKEISAAAHAAVRETKEEADVGVASEDLVLMSCWTTPALGNRPRFRTWFFVAEIADQQVRVDGAEMIDHRWMTLEESIKPITIQSLGMLPPTYNTLLDIHAYPDVKTAIGSLREQPLRVYNPKLIGIDGGFISLYEGDVGYEAEDLSAQGPRHRMRGDKDGYHLERTVW